jgi:hypothetical protein
MRVSAFPISEEFESPDQLRNALSSLIRNQPKISPVNRLTQGILKKTYSLLLFKKVTFQPKTELSRLGTGKDSTLENICKAEILLISI